MLLSGANPNSRCPAPASSTPSPLHNAPVLSVAAHQGYEDVVAMLLDFGANPNLAGEHDGGMSPLCHAARQGHVGCIRQLVTKKAKVFYYLFVIVIDVYPYCSLSTNGSL